MMRKRLAMCLALMLAFTSMACVCAPSVGDQPADAHHGHAQISIDETADCLNPDCDGDCSQILARVMDRDENASSGSEFDEPNDIGCCSDPSIPIEIQLAQANADPPTLHRNAITPVRLKDRLVI